MSFGLVALKPFLVFERLNGVWCIITTASLLVFQLYLSELLDANEGNVLADLWRDDDLDHLENRENHRYITRLNGDNGDLIGETPCPYADCDKLFSSAGALR